MTTAREIMSSDVSCVREDDTLLDAAKQMANKSVGALPVCGNDDRLLGMVTDRDIVVRALAEGLDPATTKVSQLTQAQKEAVTIGADDDADEIMRTMSSHQVRRLPVIDGTRLVGIVAQADVARALPDPKVGDLIQAISAG
jgi:CBS domain-containing protein